MEIKEFEKELRDIQSKITPLLEREKEIKAYIKLNCNKEHTTKYGGISCQVVPAYYTLEFNVDAFKEKHIDLYEEYLEPVLHNSQVKIVLSKEKENK